MILKKGSLIGFLFVIIIKILIIKKELLTAFGETVKITTSSENNDKIFGGSKIVWLPSKKFYLCDNYHFSVSTPNSYIYPKLEIYILDSTLTQGFTIFLRCGKLATPYNYDVRINIPSGITKGSKIESKLPLCNFPLLYNNAYNIDIYVGNVDIEFTRRHYCPCSPEYVVLSIGCLVEYNSDEIITLSPSKEYNINGFLTSTVDNGIYIGDKINNVNNNINNKISGMQITKMPERTNNHKLPLNNLKIVSTPACVLENNEYVTFCNVNLFFSIQLDSEGESGTGKLLENDSNLNNICVYISPYIFKEGIISVMDEDEKKGEMYLNNISTVFGDGNTDSSLSSIPVLKNHLISPFSPNICIGLTGVLQSLKNQISNHTIQNEKLPSQLRSYVDSVTIQLSNEIDYYELKRQSIYSNKNDESSLKNGNFDSRNVKVNLVLNNVRPSKYFVYPFVLQYTSEHVGTFGGTVDNRDGGMVFTDKGEFSMGVKSSGFNDYYVKLYYNLNYLQYSSDNHVVKWLPTVINSKYNIEELPKTIDSKLNMNVNLNIPFYIVIPKIVTNILSFLDNKIEIYIEKELSYLFTRLNTTINIEYTGLLGRYPLQENYNVLKGDSEIKETKIINFIDEAKFNSENSLNSDINLNEKKLILEIQVPTSIMSLGTPFAMRFIIKPIQPLEFPLKSLNIEVKHKVVPVSCNKDTCSRHGDCYLNEYIGNINIYCSCYPGWGGLYCSKPYLSYQSILAYPISLVGTNFVAIPTVYVCIYKRKWLVAILAFIAGLVSSIFHAAEVGLLIDHGNILLKGDLISAQLIISFVFILLCRFKKRIEIALLLIQIIILILLTLFTSRLTTTIIPIFSCFLIIFARIFYWYCNTKIYSEKIPSNRNSNINLEISCTIPIELTDTPNTPKNIIPKEHHNEFNVCEKHEENKLREENKIQEEMDEVEMVKKQENNKSANVIEQYGLSDVTIPFDISKLTEMVSLSTIINSSNPVSPLNEHNNKSNNSASLNSNHFCDNTFFRKIKYHFTNLSKKLIFIFYREYYSPKFILIGAFCGTFGCITWFLETVDTYWIFHSLWHIMAFLASTFIIHGCIPNSNCCVYNNKTIDYNGEYNNRNCQDKNFNLYKDNSEIKFSSFSSCSKDKNKKSRIQSNNDSKTPRNFCIDNANI
ncbi:hypothetical protein FG379_000025 [Cryptosporidium bovis]|uniref:uncharacterized protein n=1 Tax=Cryptosporidium bovis TaxID=310047 RepID=UPI00351A5625|nr:hypothetical protein FG379_000025 [Cryptosporidium bovis]